MNLECGKTVRPTVCLNDINAHYMSFDTVCIDNDVVVNNDVFIDNQILFTGVNCIGCPESCVCPIGAIGDQGSQGPVGLVGPVGPVGPSGIAGPAGSEDGSQGMPTSVAEHYLYAIRDSDSSPSEQELPVGQDVFIELGIDSTDSWGMGSGSSLLVPATGVYQVTNEVRLFVDPGDSNQANSVSFTTFLKRNGVMISSSLCPYRLMGRNTYPNTLTLRCTYLVYLAEGDTISFCTRRTSGSQNCVIKSNDGINAVLIAIYLGNTVGGT